MPESSVPGLPGSPDSRGRRDRSRRSKGTLPDAESPPRRMSGDANPESHQQITVRRLRADEWQAFRDLRLAALRTDPLAFGSTLSRESTYSDQKWRNLCNDGATGTSNVTFVAADPSGELVGMVGTFSAEGTSHVWGMWTRPHRRNQGIGHRLMNSLLDWIATCLPEVSIILDVNPSQEAAVRIYASAGFHFNGVEEPLGHDPPAVVRQMVRRPGRALSETA